MSSLRDFREVVQREADRTLAPTLGTILARQRPTSFRWAWAVATATVVLALFAVPYYNQRQMQAAQDRADAELMQQVNRALSRSVPQALEPLMGEKQCEPKSC